MIRCTSNCRPVLQKHAHNSSGLFTMHFFHRHRSIGSLNKITNGQLFNRNVAVWRGYRRSRDKTLIDNDSSVRPLLFPEVHQPFNLLTIDDVDRCRISRAVFLGSSSVCTNQRVVHPCRVLPCGDLGRPCVRSHAQRCNDKHLLRGELLQQIRNDGESRYRLAETEVDTNERERVLMHKRHSDVSLISMHIFALPLDVSELRANAIVKVHRE